MRYTFTTPPDTGGQIETARTTSRLPRQVWVSTLAVALCSLTMVQTLPPADAAGGKFPVAKPGVSSTATGEQLSVNLSQSRVIKLRTQVARVSVADPEIADILVLDPNQIYVVGKKLGTTNLMLWDTRDHLSGNITLEVTPDLEQLKTRLHEVMPGEKVQVRSAQGAIVVSGEASSPEKADAAVQLAERLAATGGGQLKVLNLLQVGGSQQVTLEVKVAEVNRDIYKYVNGNVSVFSNAGGFKMGTVGNTGGTFPATTPFSSTSTTTTNALNNNYSANNSSNFNNNNSYNNNFNSQQTDSSSLPPTTSITAISPTQTIVTQNPANLTQTNTTGQTALAGAATGAAQTAINALTGSSSSTSTSTSSSLNPFTAAGQSLANRGIFSSFLGGNYLINATLEAGKQMGLVKILAEPNLTTLSGQAAKFQAGGEFPYQVAAALGQAPTIEFKQYGIILQFLPVVLDSGVISLKLSVTASEPNPALMVNGTPSLRTRFANATVEVKSGQAISIAGLISETLRSSSDKFPGLGEIPILGMLFRSQAFQKNQTELVILVTPRLAQPFDAQKAKLPTENFVEPTDLEFYILGRVQGRNKPKADDTAPAGALGPDKSGSEGAFGHDL